MKIELNQEICCELCNDGIHVHMDCPACKKCNASTDIYGNAWEHWDHNEIPQFSCEECKTEFRARKTLKEIQAHEGIYYTEWDII